MAEEKPPISIEVDDKKFQEAVSKASEQVSDLSLPLQLIAKQWFQSNKSLFVRSGAGRFEDLSAAYKKRKQAEVGFIYPILRRSGMLEGSVTEPTDSDSINILVNKKGLILGTKNPYASFLQLGTSKMPARPFVLIGAEQTGPPEFNTRLEIWERMLMKYVNQKLAQVGEVKET